MCLPKTLCPQVLGVQMKKAGIMLYIFTSRNLLGVDAVADGP